MNFTEYKKYVHKDLPKIQGDIQDTLEEEIHVPEYEDYIGPEHRSPESRGFVRSFGSVYSHPDHPGKGFHFDGGAEPKEFPDVETAIEHMGSIYWKRDKKVTKFTNELVDKTYKPERYTDDHKSAIATYTDINSLINTKLLNGTAHEHSAYSNAVRHLDAAMKVNHTPDDMVVYSGTNSDHAQLLRNHDVVEHPGFISTSLNIKKAMSFAGVKDGDLMKIHIPAGHQGVFPHTMSMIPSEQEFILPRNMRLRIDHSKREVIYYDRMKNKKTIVHHMYPVEE